MIALLRLLLVATAVTALEVACRTGAIAPTAVIPPSAMAAALWSLLLSGTETANLLATATRILASTTIAAVLGLAAGLLLHAVPRLRTALDPVLSSWNAIPSVMFYPVLLVLFGVGSGAIIAIAVILAVVAMLSSTLTGLDQVPPVLLRTARALRLSRTETQLRVRLPAARPFLFTGLRLVVAYAVIGVIAAEFILSGSGLGYAIANAYNDFDNRTMYALMLLVLLSVTALNAALQAIDTGLRTR